MSFSLTAAQRSQGVRVYRWVLSHRLRFRSLANAAWCSWIVRLPFHGVSVMVSHGQQLHAAQKSMCHQSHCYPHNDTHHRTSHTHIGYTAIRQPSNSSWCSCIPHTSRLGCYGVQCQQNRKELNELSSELHLSHCRCCRHQVEEEHGTPCQDSSVTHCRGATIQTEIPLTSSPW